MSAARWVIAVTAFALCALPGGAVWAQSHGGAHAAHAAATPAPGHATAGHGTSGGTTTGGAAGNATASEGTVNINSATEEELERLPGIGPARAAAIVALRQRVQRFRSPDDLVRVRGIGRAAMRRLRPYVTLAGDTTLAARPGRAARSAHAEGTAGAEGAESAGGGQP